MAPASASTTNYLSNNCVPITHRKVQSFLLEVGGVDTRELTLPMRRDNSPRHQVNIPKVVSLVWSQEVIMLDIQAKDRANSGQLKNVCSDVLYARLRPTCNHSFLARYRSNDQDLVYECLACAKKKDSDRTNE